MQRLNSTVRLNEREREFKTSSHIQQKRELKAAFTRNDSFYHS